MELLVIATKYMFWDGFVGMAAGTLYFILERNQLAAQYRSTATLGAIICFIAAIHYKRRPASWGIHRHLAPYANGGLDAAAFIERHAGQHEDCVCRSGRTDFAARAAAVTPALSPAAKR